MVFWVLWIPEFGWTYNQLTAASALNYAGMAIGCIVFIPAVKYGRRLVYLISTAVILALAAWSAYLNTITELCVSQFLFGLASATNETIVQMMVGRNYFCNV